MKNQYIILATFFTINNLHAQNQANNWYFGDSAGISFSTNPPTAISGGTVDWREGCTSMSDTNGNLLFYSGGVKVWDRTHNVMPNGTGLLGNTSSTQSALAVPMPGSSTLYYLFTAPGSSTNQATYSIVDMSLNNGFGDITIKNHILLGNSTEKLTAVFHSNGTDVWIILHAYPNNNFYAYLLTASGLSTVPIVSSTGNVLNTPSNKNGYLKASNCGNRLAMASSALGTPCTMELFDFDNITGIVSNGAQIGSLVNADGFYGCEFSPDNTKLYVSIVHPALLIQFDLIAGSTAAITASMDTVGVPSSSQVGALQTGPDGRIYLANYFETYLSAIMNPNQPATTCGYIDNYVTLSSYCRYGLPNFVSSYFCNIPSGINEPQPHEAVSLSPNPATTTCTITAPNITNNATLTLYDITGRALLHQVFNGQATINVAALKAGMYVVEIKDKEGRSVKGKLLKSDY